MVLIRRVGLSFILLALSFVSTAQLSRNAADTERVGDIARLAGSLSVSRPRAADLLYIEALRIQEAIYGQNNADYARMLLDMVELRISMQRLDGLEQMLDRVLSIDKNLFGQKSIEYAEALSLKGLYYTYASDFTKAEATFAKAFATAARAGHKDDYEFGKIVHKAVILHTLRQDYKAAEYYCQKAIDIYAGTQSISDRKYLEARGSMAIIYAYTARMDQAESLIGELLPVIEGAYGKDNSIYASLASTLGSIYSATGRDEAAIRIMEELLPLIEEMVGQKHEGYYNALNGLAAAYMKSDRFQQAEPLLIRSLELRKESGGESSPAYIKGLNNLAVLYMNMGNYYRAAQTLLLAAELSIDVLGEKSDSHIVALTNLAGCFQKLGQSDEAVELAGYAEDILGRYNLLEDPRFASISALNALALLNSGVATPEIEKKLLAAEKNLLKIAGQSDQTYQNVITSLSLYYLEKRDYHKALEYSKRDIVLSKKYRGEISSASLRAVTNCGAICHRMDREEEAEAYFTEVLGIIKQLGWRNFAFMSSSQREQYWRSLQNTLTLITEFVAGSALRGNGKPSQNTLLYDCVLFSKSLMLNSSAEMQRAILTSGDQQAIVLWQRLQALKSDPRGNVEEIESLDKELALISVAFERQKSNFSVGWKNVRDNLSAQEASIEFVPIAAEVGGEAAIYYAGLILRSEYRHPELVMLAREVDVIDALKRSPYDGSYVYPLLLGPLEKYLDGVNALYISTGGAINSVSFTGMRSNKGYIIDTYSICNLMSTADIVNGESMPEKRNIALFGGADFGLSAEALIRLDKETEEVVADQELYINMLQTRGQGFGYLPGSKKEVVEIGVICCKRAVRVSAICPDRKKRWSK